MSVGEREEKEEKEEEEEEEEEDLSVSFVFSLYDAVVKCESCFSDVTNSWLCLEISCWMFC